MKNTSAGYQTRAFRERSRNSEDYVGTARTKFACLNNGCHERQRRFSQDKELRRVAAAVNNRAI